MFSANFNLLEKRHSTDAKAELTKMLELSIKDIKAASSKIVQQVR